MHFHQRLLYKTQSVSLEISYNKTKTLHTKLSIDWGRTQTQELLIPIVHFLPQQSDRCIFVYKPILPSCPSTCCIFVLVKYDLLLLRHSTLWNHEKCQVIHILFKWTVTASTMSRFISTKYWSRLQNILALCIYYYPHIKIRYNIFT